MLYERICVMEDDLCRDKSICVKEEDKCRRRHLYRSRQICDMEGRCVYHRSGGMLRKANVCRGRQLCVVKGYC